MRILQTLTVEYWGRKGLVGLYPPEIPRSVDIQKYLTSLHIDEWMRNDVLQSRWWILLGMLLLSLAAWYLLLDKARMKDIFLYVILAFLCTLSLDEYGDELILWDYPTDIIPIFPPLTSINLIILPLSFSLAYQRFSSWRSFIPAALIISAAVSFVMEPLLAWGGLYELVNWNHALNFAAYAILALTIRFLTTRINRITQKTSARHRLGQEGRQ